MIQVILFCYLDKPSAPTGPLAVSDIKEDSVTLSWQPSESDGGSPITGYTIEKCDTKRMTWSKVADVDEKTLTYAVQKLIEGQQYLFRVSAVNAEGQGKPLQCEKDVTPKKPPGK